VSNAIGFIPAMTPACTSPSAFCELDLRRRGAHLTGGGSFEEEAPSGIEGICEHWDLVLRC